jgi:Kef-type K+ transport system membrane component KefB
MLELALFLGAGWFLGRAFRSWGAPAILAEILVGVVLGPELLNVVPYAKSACSADHNPSILVLIGNMGVALMIFESGMHLHFDKVAEVGKDAFIVACIGTLTPIVLGIGTGVALGYNIFPDCLSLGIALAPTSVGIALNLLNDAKFLNSTPGQIIITAAFVDDIFSLVMLVILINVAAGEVTAASVVLPLVLSFAFVGLGVWLATRVMPQVKVLINRVPENRKLSLQPRDEVHLGLMTAAIVFFGWVGSLIGSHLLGTFVAGLSFANVPRSGMIWSRQVKRILGWMMRLFFSASIAFSIPLSVMFTAKAFLRGLALATIPCIGGKLLSGLVTGKMKYIVGWAMVARGEFAYVSFLLIKSTNNCNTVCVVCVFDFW